MSRRGRRRVLDAEETALWTHVTRSVAPLRPRPAEPSEAAPPAPPVEEEPAAPIPAARDPAARAARPAAPPLARLAPLEPKVRRKLGRGAEVDARLDLHGLTQAAAHRRLRSFIIEAQATGFALVLVITGKGAPEGIAERPALHEEARGVLRRAVPLWLAEPDLRSYVVGFETAARRHGGEGALYVRIRRRR